MILSRNSGTSALPCRAAAQRLYVTTAGSPLRAERIIVKGALYFEVDFPFIADSQTSVAPYPFPGYFIEEVWHPPPRLLTP